MDSSSFGIKLKELRTAAGLTQAALAEKAGVSKGGIANIEQGIREPVWSTIVALAAALGVDCSAFQQSPPTAETEVKKPAKRRKRGSK